MSWQGHTNRQEVRLDADVDNVVALRDECVERLQRTRNLWTTIACGQVRHTEMKRTVN